MSRVLECTGLTGGWGSLTAFRNVDLAVDAGRIHAIFGPNGAGKTTLLLTLAGLLPAQAGAIAVGGVPLRTGRATAASRAGIVLVPDNRELFITLSVEENLRVAARRGGPEPHAVLGFFPALQERCKVRAGVLSGGEQQMLAMARALIQRPKVLLVDELSMGLAPKIVERLFSTIRTVATESACAVLFVEQYIHLALHVADSATVLNRGNTVLTGLASEMSAHPEQLERAYLGSSTPWDDAVPRPPRSRSTPEAEGV